MWYSSDINLFELTSMFCFLYYISTAVFWGLLWVTALVSERNKTLDVWWLVYFLYRYFKCIRRKQVKTKEKKERKKKIQGKKQKQLRRKGIKSV